MLELLATIRPDSNGRLEVKDDRQSIAIRMGAASDCILSILCHLFPLAGMA